MSIHYSAGVWFAVPLRDSDFATGIVARASPKGRQLLAYFFGPRLPAPLKLDKVDDLRAKDALRAILVGDLHLIDGRWPIVGASKSWNSSDWPIPVFLRREPGGVKAWRVYRSENDLSILREEPDENPSRIDLERDGLYGAGAVELLLTQLLSG